MDIMITALLAFFNSQAHLEGAIIGSMATCLMFIVMRHLCDGYKARVALSYVEEGGIPMG